MLQQYYAFSLSFVFKALLINQTLYFQLFKEKKVMNIQVSCFILIMTRISPKCYIFLMFYFHPTSHKSAKEVISDDHVGEITLTKQENE